MPTTVKKPCPTKPALAQLKSLNSDQLNRLQTKQQQDLDLLDDIRSFLKQRATIEKEYGQALLKLSTSYLQKKDYAVSAFELQNTSGKNLMSVWKSMLETSETFARESLTLSDQLSAQCSEPLKQFRVLKVALLRRTVDQLKALQSDLQTNVGELVKAAKAYQDVEHETHEARMKATELDEKLKKKSTGLFTSRATLEKTSQKMATKRDACEVKSVSSRNEYLFALASCNAANARFWQTELLELTQQLDSDAHARMRDSLLCALRSELQLACSKQERFGRLLMDLSNVSQTYQLECFFEEYASLFTEQPTYSFEPVDGDPITHLLGSEAELQAELKRLASRYVADLDAKQTLERQLRHAQQARDAQGVQSVTSNQLGSTSTDEPSAVVGTQQTAEMDSRIDDLKQQVRRLGIQCCRNEAKLNLFRSTSGNAIDVDEVVTKLQAELQASKPPQPPSPPATPALRTSQPPASVSPAPSATVAASAPVLASNHQRATSKTSVTSANTAYSNSTMASNDGHREANANANVTPFVTWDDEPDMDLDNTQQQTQTKQQTNAQTYVEFDDDDPLVVAALYDFDASNTDELTVRAGERLRAVQEPTINEQGWMQVENSNGQRGIVPEAYVQFTNPDRYSQVQQAPAQPEAEPVADWSNEPDYANWGDPNLSNDANSTQNASLPDTQKRSVSIAFDQYRIVRALYDYEAQSEDEINLHEGDYLLVDARVDIHADDGEATTDDDDGWWFGCLLRMSQDVLTAEGLRAPGCGVFPSLVVEPIDDSDWLELSAMSLSKDTLDSLTRRIPQLKASLVLARENDAGAAQPQPDASASDPDVAPRGAQCSNETTAQAPCADDGEAALKPDEIADASASANANANENGNENANDNESDNVCNATACENENGNEPQALTAQVSDTVDDAAQPSSTSLDAVSTTEPSAIHDQNENDDTKKLAFQLDEESLA